MAFETFKKRMVPLSKQPYVTIQRRGIISMNAAAWVMLGSPEAVELLYDEAEKLVGLRAVDKATEHAYGVRGAATKAESTYIVSGVAFANYYGIDTSSSIRRRVEMRDGTLVVDLKDPGTEVTGNRRRVAAY